MRFTGISAERLDVLVDVVDAADHPARPVLEIHVERDAVLRAVLDRPADVVEVLLVRLLQLLAAVMQRALRQQVDDARADRFRPVDRSIAVDEPENLDAIGPALRLGVIDNRLHRAALALADARRRHFDAIDLDGLEQPLGDGALLLGHHRDAFGLLAIAKRRIHDLDTTGFPFAHIFRESIALTYETPGRLAPARRAPRCCIVQQRKNIRNAGPDPRRQPRQDGDSRQARGDSGADGRDDDAVEGADGEHARQHRAGRPDHERDRRRRQPGGRHEDHQARHGEARRAGARRAGEARREVPDARATQCRTRRSSIRTGARATSTPFAAIARWRSRSSTRSARFRPSVRRWIASSPKRRRSSRRKGSRERRHCCR